MKNLILKVENLSVRLDGNVVLEKVSFSLPLGELLMVLGPNGAGKSILIKAILGIVAYSGTVDISFRRSGLKRIGYVPQYIDFDRSIVLTVAEVVEFGLLGLKVANPRQKVDEMIKLVGLEGKANDSFASLSGGQSRRALIAQAMIGKPKLLILDEPMAGVDLIGEKTFYDTLSGWKRENNMSIILVSHDYNLVNKMADRVLCLNKQMVCYSKPEKLSGDSFEKLFGHKALIHHH